MNKNNSNNRFLIILLFVGVIIVFFFPMIHNFFYKVSMPKIEKSKEEVKEDKKELTEEILAEIHTPKMRNSAYSDFTYYSLDKFKITDMSNQDILLNAFLDVYEGNIIDSGHSSSCSATNKEISSKYINLRVKNILGRNLKYTLEDFYVPEDSNSKYTGNWIYSNDTFYYNGLCSSNASSVRMYDIETRIDAKYDNDDILVTYYVGFVKYDGDNYTIYSDALMTNEIGSGTGSDYKTVFDNLDNNLKKKYEYRYKNTLCTYDEYCLYEGRWL